jgi:hypothetical protein
MMASFPNLPPKVGYGDKVQIEWADTGKSNTIKNLLTVLFNSHMLCQKGRRFKI